VARVEEKRKAYGVWLERLVDGNGLKGL